MKLAAKIPESNTFILANNYIPAEYLLQKATASTASANELLWLARYYEFGFGVAQDTQRAYELCHRSVGLQMKKPNPNKFGNLLLMQYLLGHYILCGFERGFRSPITFVSGFHLIQHAALGGNGDAKKYIAQIADYFTWPKLSARARNASFARKESVFELVYELVVYAFLKLCFAVQRDTSVETWSRSG